MQIKVTVTKGTGNLAAGAVFANSIVTVLDDTGQSQSATLTGAESPPWEALFTVPDGHGGSVSVKDFDQAGLDITPAPLSQTYDSTGTGGGSVGDTFPASTALAIAAA